MELNFDKEVGTNNIYGWNAKLSYGGLYMKICRNYTHVQFNIRNVMPCHDKNRHQAKTYEIINIF